MSLFENDAAIRALAIMPKITGLLSIVADFWILRQLFLGARKKSSGSTSSNGGVGGGGSSSQAQRGISPYGSINRALCGMCFMDIFGSFGWFLSTWALPAETGAPFATGTQGTCTLQGFLVQSIIGAPMYNCVLAAFYLLIVKRGWRDSDLRRMERWLHLPILLFTFGTSIVLIPLGMYNPLGVTCWVMGKPQGCGNSVIGEGSGEACERGDNAWAYGLSFFYVPLWICIVFASLAMALLYRNVNQTRRASNLESSSSATAATTRGRTKRLSTTATLYTVAFLVTWIPSTVATIAYWIGRPVYWLDLLAVTFEPCQGILNWLVFVRPKLDLRTKVRSASLVCCNGLMTCLFGCCGIKVQLQEVDDPPDQHPSLCTNGTGVAESDNKDDIENQAGNRAFPTIRIPGGAPGPCSDLTRSSADLPSSFEPLGSQREIIMESIIENEQEEDKDASTSSANKTAGDDARSVSSVNTQRILQMFADANTVVSAPRMKKRRERRKAGDADDKSDHGNNDECADLDNEDLNALSHVFGNMDLDNEDLDAITHVSGLLNDMIESECTAGGEEDDARSVGSNSTQKILQMLSDAKTVISAPRMKRRAARRKSRSKTVLLDDMDLDDEDLDAITHVSGLLNDMIESECTAGGEEDDARSVGSNNTQKILQMLSDAKTVMSAPRTKRRARRKSRSKTAGEG